MGRSSGPGRRILSKQLSPGQRLLDLTVDATNRGVVVTNAADHGCAVRWFVGVITATTKRRALIRGLVRPVAVGRSKGAGLVGKFVTPVGESWPCATPTDFAANGCEAMLAVMNGDVRRDRRGRAHPAGRRDACPRCRGVLRPFGTGRTRTRTVRGVGADIVIPRGGPRCRDCAATQILLPTELVLRRADSTEAIGYAPGRQIPWRRVPQHRRPLRASRVDGPPLVAGCAGAEATLCPNFRDVASRSADHTGGASEPNGPTLLRGASPILRTQPSHTGGVAADRGSIDVAPAISGCPHTVDSAACLHRACRRAPLDPALHRH